MANILPLLNEHIQRLARREIRRQTGRTRKIAAKHRRDIAALKRMIRVLVSRLGYLEKRAAHQMPIVSLQKTQDRLRFRADGLKSHRARLGISARAYGKLVGVSGLTIYHWETSKSKPRRRQLAALSMVRGMGKREALKRLGE